MPFDQQKKYKDQFEERINCLQKNMESNKLELKILQERYNKVYEAISKQE